MAKSKAQTGAPSPAPDALRPQAPVILMGQHGAVVLRPRFTLPGDSAWDQAFSEKRENPLLERPASSEQAANDEALLAFTNKLWDLRERDKTTTAALARLAADGEQAGTDALHDRAARAVRMLYFLSKRGDAATAAPALDLAATMVENLNALSAENPDVFRKTAEDRLTWPVLKSPHAKLGDDHERIIDVLDVGSVLWRVFPKRLKWNPRLPANRVALSLLLHVASVRGGLHRFYGSRPQQREASPPGGRTFPDWAWKARELKELGRSPGVIAAWWAVAKEALDEAYSDLAAVPQLRKLVRAESHRVSLAARIHQKIQEAFEGICGLRQSEPRRARKS